MDLSDEQRRFLELTNRFGKIKGLQNIRDLFGGRSEVRNVVEDMGYEVDLVYPRDVDSGTVNFVAVRESEGGSVGY